MKQIILLTFGDTGLFRCKKSHFSILDLSSQIPLTSSLFYIFFGSYMLMTLAHSDMHEVSIQTGLKKV